MSVIDNIFIALGVIIIVGLFVFLLSFHVVAFITYKLDKLSGVEVSCQVTKILPKNRLTFSQTFLKIDIKEWIDRYNNTSAFERQDISQEIEFVLLQENGIISKNYNSDEEE